MDVLATDGAIVQVSQASLYRVPAPMVASALLNIVHAATYCIPCRAWFIHGQFPRLRAPNRCPVPSLRLMQRMAHYVATHGSTHHCEALVQAAAAQAKRGGAPWSWFAIDVPVLLTRCDPVVPVQLLRYFTAAYRGAEQYACIVLPMLLNALQPTDVDTPEARSALLWVHERLVDTLTHLKPCLKMACAAAVPIPERRAALQQIWREATPRGREEVLVLANCAGTMPYLLPLVGDVEPLLEHEAVWNWVVHSLQHDEAVLKNVLSPRIHACLDNWLPIDQAAATAAASACCICMEDFSTSAAACVRLHTCSHVFHAACLFKWVLKKRECPMCREPTATTNTGIRVPSTSDVSTFRYFTELAQRLAGHGIFDTEMYFYDVDLENIEDLYTTLDFEFNTTSSVLSIEFVM